MAPLWKCARLSFPETHTAHAWRFRESIEESAGPVGGAAEPLYSEVDPLQKRAVRKLHHQRQLSAGAAVGAASQHRPEAVERADAARMLSQQDLVTAVDGLALRSSSRGTDSVSDR